MVPVLSRRTDEGPFGPRTKKEKSHSNSIVGGIGLEIEVEICKKSGNDNPNFFHFFDVTINVAKKAINVAKKASSSSARSLKEPLVLAS